MSSYPLKISLNESYHMIIDSGWVGYYHVIVEDPLECDLNYFHEFMSEKKVCFRYGISPLELRENFHKGEE